MNNYLAVLTILIGIIIIVAIYTDNHHISRFFWTYTRQDYRSYYYAGNDSIVRMRSIFSEPAHLGHYLNTIFFANLFFNKSKKGYILIILMLGILLTFSYSMIFIFLITGFSYLLVNTIKGNIKWTKKVWYLVIPMTLILAMLWDIIYVTIIERTINILSGMDGSAYNRIIESWIYVENERLIFGNGIGHTPPITNIYAYVISDFGLIGFIPYLGLTGYIILNSLTTGILFITMNMAKGGYLNPSFWLFLLFVFLYGIIPSIKEKVNSNELEGKIYV
ncbi:hypothetical protein ACO1PF_10025 [Alkalibacterium sp. f15]|uniref:hypothetical protein n=1 Tax=Alkalibacterium sp. f15 TaxID=3414029 RepID=UPI003BF90824